MIPSLSLSKVIPALLLLACLAVCSLLTGVASFSFADLLQGDAHAWQITVISRIPRLASIILAGAGLSVAGLIMQQITQNRFASPSTVGTIDSALLGYVVGLVLLSDGSTWSLLGVIFASVGGTLLFVKFYNS